MATLYKGAAPGTFWHQNDPRLVGGFQSAPMTANSTAAVRHITAYSHPSAFVSFTASYAIAYRYARVRAGGIADRATPGVVWEIDTALAPCVLYDPVALISGPTPRWNSGPRLPTHHDGDDRLILGIASNARKHLHAIPLRAGGATSGPASVQAELRALVYALRDAEVLAERIPAACVVACHEVA